MKQYLSAYTVKQGENRDYWTRLGAAFPTKNGGFVLFLDAAPASVEGTMRIVLQPPKAPSESESAPRGKQPARTIRR